VQIAVGGTSNQISFAKPKMSRDQDKPVDINFAWKNKGRANREELHAAVTKKPRRGFTQIYSGIRARHMSA